LCDQPENAGPTNRQINNGVILATYLPYAKYVARSWDTGEVQHRQCEDQSQDLVSTSQAMMILL